MSGGDQPNVDHSMYEIGMLASALFSLECLRVTCRHWETKKIFLFDGDSPHLDDCRNHDSIDCCTVSTHGMAYVDAIVHLSEP